jgi:molybdopterin synthase sulfur carrier subunit
MKVRLLYFARLREVFDRGSEDVSLPDSVHDVRGLIEWLRGRGGAFASELAPGRAFRVAVNQEMATEATGITDAAEVAIFPPVTGG